MAMYLERVDLCGLNTVQIQSFLIATLLCRPSGLSQEATTKNKTLWVEPVRQRLFGIYTVYRSFM